MENKISVATEQLSSLRVADSQRRAGDSGYYLQIVELEKQLDLSKSLLSVVNDTVLIKEPTVSPIKSKAALYVALAAVMGLFAGLFTVLAIDWWKKS